MAGGRFEDCGEGEQPVRAGGRGHVESGTGEGVAVGVRIGEAES